MADVACVMYVIFSHFDSTKKICKHSFWEVYIYVHKYVYTCVYTYLCKMDEYRSYAGLS